MKIRYQLLILCCCIYREIPPTNCLILASIHFADCNHLCRSTGSITWTYGRFRGFYFRFTNKHYCSKSNITRNWNCIPTTTTDLQVSFLFHLRLIGQTFCYLISMDCCVSKFLNLFQRDSQAPYSWNMVNLFSFGCHVINRSYLRTYVRVYRLYRWDRGDYQKEGRGVLGVSWQIRIFYIGYSQYGQLTAVKTGQPLTSIT